jgi:hypothetical protein
MAHTHTFLHIYTHACTHSLSLSLSSFLSLALYHTQSCSRAFGRAARTSHSIRGVGGGSNDSVRVELVELPMVQVSQETEGPCFRTVKVSGADWKDGGWGAKQDEVRTPRGERGESQEGKETRPALIY